MTRDSVTGTHRAGEHCRVPDDTGDVDGGAHRDVHAGGAQDAGAWLCHHDIIII